MSRRPRVLIVDDSQLVLDWVRLVFDAVDIDTVALSQSLGSGAAALRAQPDLILLDINMPALRGDDLLQLFRRHAELRDTPILLHSDLEESELAAIAKRFGADGYIRKMNDPDALVRAVRPWIERQARSRQLPQPLFVEDDARVLALYERAFGRTLGGEYVATVEEALARIESATPPSVIVADVVLGHQSALYLYERAVAHDPTWSERFVFVTGRPFSGAVDELLKDLRAPVLYKPVDTERLRALVEQMSRPIGTPTPVAA
ncbi:MAG: response regulator [Myxococcota bacterium]